MALTAAEGRRHRQREETRREILEAAESLLAESGDDDFSIRRLAARSGYTAPTLYQHFGDKDGLVDALIERRFGEFASRLQAVPPPSDPLEGVRLVARMWLEFAIRNPALYRLLLSAAHRREKSMLASVEKARELMQAPMDELANAGRLVVPDRQIAQQAMFALTHGLASLNISRPEFDWSVDRSDVAIDALLRGLVAPAPLERN